MVILRGIIFQEQKILSLIIQQVHQLIKIFIYFKVIYMGDFININ